MVIGIIAAMSSEMNHISDSLNNKIKHTICGVDFFEGEINNHKVIVSQSGVGKVNSSINTTLLINNFYPELVINSGIAGGTKELNTGDFIIADKLTYSDFDCQVFNYTFGQVPGMPQYYFSDEKYKKLLEDFLTSKGIEYKNSTILTADSFRLSSIRS